MTQGFLKNRKTQYSDFREAPPWLGASLGKISNIQLSNLECWKRHFRDKITKNFTVVERVM